jgi:leucine dehydrogenase
MDAFELMSRYGFGELHVARDEASGLEAVVAIHDDRLGPALGGCRFIHYGSAEAAVVDALRLARGMTYKAALAGLPHGGGKAVLRRPAGAFDRAALFRAFGRFVEKLGGRYITAEDSGTSPADMALVRRETRHVTGIDAESSGGRGGGNPSPFTALGVRRGIEAAASAFLGARSLEGLTVAVQGVGQVGHRLCAELHERGAALIVADAMPERAAAAAEAFGAKVVPLEAIHRARCDVFAPCALGAGIDDRTLPELACKVVAGAANNQLAEPRHGDALWARGIFYAPDYAINAGGLIHVASEHAGYDAAAVRERTLRIYDTIAAIASRAKERDVSPHRVADELAEERLASAAVPRAA